MRVAGYFSNSHFFNIIQKFAIDEWNSKIDSMRGQKDLYILKDIRFINRKTIIQRIDNKE